MSPWVTCQEPPSWAKLVTVTRLRKAPAQAMPGAGRWKLRDAKARFSEVVRRAKSEGPQRITVHGREEVVVVAVEEYRRALGEPTGQALVALLRNSPLRDLAFERPPTAGRVRGVEL